MNITNHFSFEEFTNIPYRDLPISVTDNITRLCLSYLEPLRLWYGEPIVINSGFRTASQNAKVGGAKNSYHCLGAAVDIRCESMDDAIQKAAWLLNRETQYIINSNLIAELIISQNQRGSCWVHLAIRKNMSDKKRVIKFETYG